jgi:hypothetical protein
MWRRVAVVGALVLAWAPPAWAEALQTDRPDIAETSRAVGQGVYQIEQAFQPEWGPTGALSLGLPSLHRFGLTRDLELRLETPLVDWNGRQLSPAPVSLGFKYSFFGPEEGQDHATAAWLCHVDRDPAGNLGALVKFALDADLPWGWESGFNAHVDKGPEAPGPHLGFAWAVAHELPGLPGLEWYGELSGDTEPRQGGRPTLGLDGGLIWLVNPNTQFDTAWYRNQDGTWYWTLGWSNRWGAPPEGDAAPTLHHAPSRHP